MDNSFICSVLWRRALPCDSVRAAHGPNLNCSSLIFLIFFWIFYVRVRFEMNRIVIVFDRVRFEPLRYNIELLFEVFSTVRSNLIWNRTSSNNVRNNSLFSCSFHFEIDYSKLKNICSSSFGFGSKPCSKHFMFVSSSHRIKLMLNK